MPKRVYHWDVIRERTLRVFKEGMTAKELRVAYNQDPEVRAKNELIDLPIIYRVIEHLDLKNGLVFPETWKKAQAALNDLIKNKSTM